MNLPAPAQLAKQKELNLFGKPVTDATLATIADVLKTNTSLKFVGFRECRNVTDVGAIAIAKSLVFNGTVKMLNFESTGVGDRGVIALAEAIPNSGLTRIELGYLRITDAAALVLANAIRLSTTLSIVTLDHCKGITEEGGRALVSALETNVTMTQLGLKGTSVGAHIRHAVEVLLAPAGLVKRQSGSAGEIIVQMNKEAAATAAVTSSAKIPVRGLKGMKSSLKHDSATLSAGSSSGSSGSSGSGKLMLASSKGIGLVTPRSEKTPTTGRDRDRDREAASKISDSDSLRSQFKSEKDSALTTALAPASVQSLPPVSAVGAVSSVSSSPLMVAEAKEARKKLLLLKSKMSERSTKRASFGHSSPSNNNSSSSSVCEAKSTEHDSSGGGDSSSDVGVGSARSPETVY